MNLNLIKLLKYVEDIKINKIEDWESTLTENIQFLKQTFDAPSLSVLEGAVWGYAHGHITKESFLGLVDPIVKKPVHN